MDPRSFIAAFDVFLAGRGLTLDAIVVGGTALHLLGVIARPTEDCDVVAPPLSAELLAAARAFAAQERTAGRPVRDDWLNNGPASLATVLPTGWEARLARLYDGTSVHLRTLARSDLLASKLFALCDRGLDLLDCVALAPSVAELAAVLPWLELQDGNPDWPEHVRDTLDDLARRLGHGV